MHRAKGKRKGKGKVREGTGRRGAIFGKVGSKVRGWAIRKGCGGLRHARKVLTVSASHSKPCGSHTMHWMPSLWRRHASMASRPMRGFLFELRRTDAVVRRVPSPSESKAPPSMTTSPHASSSLTTSRSVRTPASSRMRPATRASSSQGGNFSPHPLNFQGTPSTSPSRTTNVGPVSRCGGRCQCRRHRIMGIERRDREAHQPDVVHARSRHPHALDSIEGSLRLVESTVRREHGDGFVRRDRAHDADHRLARAGPPVRPHVLTLRPSHPALCVRLPLGRKARCGGRATGCFTDVTHRRRRICRHRGASDRTRTTAPACAHSGASAPRIAQLSRGLGD